MTEHEMNGLATSGEGLPNDPNNVPENGNGCELIENDTPPAPVAASAVDDLPFRRRDIERGLILFRTSSNAHGSINFVSLASKVGALPQPAKNELANLMRNIAQGLSPVAASAVDAPDKAYELGKEDGYSEAIQQIDRRTGGDGEYRYCTDHDPDHHVPDVQTMIERIIARFAATQKQGGDL